MQTFLLADLAGFTALTEAHGDEFAADVVEAFYRAVDQLLSEHAGEEVKQIGDGVLVRVPRAGDALRLAARAVSELGARDGKLDLRVGMHTGSAVLRRGDWFGATVNLAARVASEAAAGEVLLTAATRDAAEHDLAGLTLQERGARRLKNVADPVELFALVRHEAGPRLARDPVCRMAVEHSRARDTAEYGGVTYAFCSSTCAQLFRAAPTRFLPARNTRRLNTAGDAAAVVKAAGGSRRCP